MSNNFYITTPIYYVNSKPHIGSIYTTIVSDTINRFKKLLGYNTYFLTGTDEHGLKIQQTAEKLGKSPKELVDEISQIFKNLTVDFGIENNDFIRTTETRHIKFVQNIWKILVKNKWIYKGKYSGWYCVSDEAYYAESDLVKDENGKFKTDIGKEVEWREEDSYFFRLSEFQDILIKFYQQNDKFIQPTIRRNETISWVGGNDLKSVLKGQYGDSLKDLSISRNNFNWGIKIPCDENNNQLLDSDGNWLDSVEENDKHVIYVWLDALFNYQTAIEDKINEFWYNSNTEIVHIVGKDIMRFHTVYWPAFLIAIKYSREEFKNITIDDIINNNILPTTVFAHGWWTNEGRKISKSFGNVIDPYEEIKRLEENYSIEKQVAIDYFRYYLLTDGIFGNDLDYSKDRFTNKINSELVNNIGNLVQRVSTMVYKNFDGKIKTIDLTQNSLLKDFKNLDQLLSIDTINKFDFEKYKNIILDLSNFANDYMEKTAPWNLKKEGKIEELKNILELEMTLIVKIIILLQVFCPYISKKILDFLGVDDRDFKHISNIINIDIHEPKGFFPRIENKNF